MGETKQRCVHSRVLGGSQLFSGGFLRHTQDGDQVSSERREDCFQNDLQQEEKMGKPRADGYPAEEHLQVPRL